MRHIGKLLIYVGWAATQLLLAQEPAEIEFGSIPVGKIHMAGFRLDSPTTIHIEAVGKGFDPSDYPPKNEYLDPNGMFVYAWIIDARTRELVWRMTSANTEKLPDSRVGRKFVGDLELPPGRYEVYFTAQKPRKSRYWNDRFPSLGKLLQRLLRGESPEDAGEETACYVRIRGLTEVYSAAEVHQFHQELKQKAVVALTADRNDMDLEVHFTLSREGKFRVYALGEGLDGEVYDYGWILSEDDQQKVWEMSYEQGEYAGGAGKNKLWAATLRLGPGTYSVHYVTDDSHSPEAWNANPPYDPEFWGILLTGVEGQYDPQSVRKPSLPQWVPVVKLRRVGNDEFVEEFLEVRQPVRVKIVAVGEGRDGEMFDYGWIEELSSGRVVWQMTYDDTRHAGGGRKNRIVETVITLPAGRYRINYVTDDSHAYANWNTTPPRNPSWWGIALFAQPRAIQDKLIQPITIATQQPVVQLVGIGNDQLVQEHFRLEKPTSLRVVALGEGMDGEMFDYGWIVDVRTGRTVWEMEYKRTHHAGGAGKNRLADEVIQLPAGEYTLYYQTDDSHAYEDWNARPPRHPERWGIALYPVDAEDSSDIRVIRHTGVPENLIARIVGVGNHAHVRKIFQLDRDTRVRIYAIGEGSWDEMFDYGWIENRHTREVVWIMNYGYTHWAGGARKNRLVDTEITLPKGEYILHYVTDDSHSFGRWNASPPRDPQNYGISLYRVE